MSSYYAQDKLFLFSNTSAPSKESIVYTKRQSSFSDLEQLFTDLYKLIRTTFPTSPEVWSVFVDFKKSEISSETMVQLLYLFISETRFKFYDRADQIPDINHCVVFKDVYTNDIPGRILILKNQNIRSSTIRDKTAIIHKLNYKVSTIRDKNTIHKKVADILPQNKSWADVSDDEEVVEETNQADTIYNIIIFSQNYKPALISASTTNIPVMLTRLGIFPPTQPLYKISFTTQGMYSASPSSVNKKMVESILNILGASTRKEFVMLDGTANTGADVVNTVIHSKNAFFVVGVEIDPINYKALTDNIKLFRLEKNTRLIMGSTLDVLQKPKEVQDINIVYFDPPWGGVNYKTQQLVDLFLGEVNIFDLSLQLADNKSSMNHLSLIVIKAPYNFNKHHSSLRHFGSFAKIENYNIPEARNIAFIYINVKDYREGKPSAMEPSLIDLLSPKKLKKILES